MFSAPAGLRGRGRMGIAETEILLEREGQVLYLARAFDEKR